MKGSTQYDEALGILNLLLNKKRCKDGSRGRAIDRAQELIAKRKEYLDSHTEYVFFCMSSRGRKVHVIREFPNDYTEDDIKAEFEDWFERDNGPGESIVKGNFRKLATDEIFEFPNYNDI